MSHNEFKWNDNTWNEIKAISQRSFYGPNKLDDDRTHDGMSGHCNGVEGGGCSSLSLLTVKIQ